MWEVWFGSPPKLLPTWTCKHCGMVSLAGQPHYCGETRSTEGAKPAKHLTEADVRRIVAEELKRYALPQNEGQK